MVNNRASVKFLNFECFIFNIVSNLYYARLYDKHLLGYIPISVYVGTLLKLNFLKFVQDFMSCLYREVLKIGHLVNRFFKKELNLVIIALDLILEPLDDIWILVRNLFKGIEVQFCKRTIVVCSNCGCSSALINHRDFLQCL